MTHILQINSSLHGEDAQSSRLASEFVAALGRDPGAGGERAVTVTVRDVEFVYAEGLALGDQQRSAAVADAVSRIHQLAA